jgi:ectoine hydroxylase-related dioxygenase (phytanoyl-CoA dioxygenase family)
MCEAVLGPDYEIVEIGFDTPFQGAKNQPWHRDFPSPPETYRDRRITSLAFNLTGVDVTQDMGPFEVAPGTQWDDGTRVEARDVPAQGAVAALSGAGSAQVPADG